MTRYQLLTENEKLNRLNYWNYQTLLLQSLVRKRTFERQSFYQWIKIMFFISEEYFIVCLWYFLFFYFSYRYKISRVFSMQILHERKHACFINKSGSLLIDWPADQERLGIPNGCQGIQLNLKVFYCEPFEKVFHLTLVVKIVNGRPEILTQDGFADLKYGLGRQKFASLWVTFLPTSFHLDSQGCS